jgi:GcrA cell cycle regulator
MNITPSWTDDRIRQLKTLAIIAQYSAREISDVMGVSRGAVIGKLARLGVQLHNAPTNPRVAEARAVARQPRPARQKPAPAQRMVLQRGKNNTYGDDVEMADMPEVTDLAPDVSEFACTIIDLTDAMCRFPIGDAHDLTTFRYCGAASHGPWCPRHRGIVYKPFGRRD